MPLQLIYVLNWERSRREHMRSITIEAELVCCCGIPGCRELHRICLSSEELASIRRIPQLSTAEWNESDCLQKQATDVWICRQMQGFATCTLLEKCPKPSLHLYLFCERLNSDKFNFTATSGLASGETQLLLPFLSPIYSRIKKCSLLLRKFNSYFEQYMYMYLRTFGRQVHVQSPSWPPSLLQHLQMERSRREGSLHCRAQNWNLCERNVLLNK